MKEPIRYLNNARETLHKSPIKYDIYTDDKYVKSAFGIAYLGVIKALDEALLNKGLEKDKLPRKVEEYEKAIKKYLSVHNGKLTTQFKALYHSLHIAGYYRGDLLSANLVKTALKNARDFIERVSK